MQYKNSSNFVGFLNYNHLYWKTITPSELTNLAENIYNNTNIYSHSRTLTDALRNVINRRGTSGLSIALAACALIKRYSGINIYTHYYMLNSDNGTNLTREKLSENLSIPTPSENNFNMYFWHIPRGKSYLKKALDNDTFLKRATALESHAVATPDQFMRIYYNWNESSNNNNCVYIISDTFNTETILNLMLLVPHFMQVNDTTNIKEEEKEKHTQRVTALFELFQVLCNIAETNTLQEIPDNETLLNATITATLQNALIKFIELFDLTSQYFDEFIKNLANVKNNKSKHYWQNRVNDYSHDIQNLERTLTEKYKILAQARHELIANQKMEPSDLSEFIDTIKQSKAIKILSIDPYKLKLRITAPLQYFQPDDFTAYENNKHSEYNNMFKDKPIWKSILHKVFVTREYQILLQSIVNIIINDSNWDSNILEFYARYDIANNADYTQFPNPHLYYYDCWSEAKTEMTKNINAGNFDLVILQMIAAVQSVNVAEQPSFVNRMLNSINTTDNHSQKLTFIINTPEGKKELKYNEMLKYEAELLLKPTTTTQLTDAQPTQQYTQIEIPDADLEGEDNENN